jgi:hypothetical protein
VFARDIDSVLLLQINASGKLAVSYAQQVSPLTKLTFATEASPALAVPWSGFAI